MCAQDQGFTVIELLIAMAIVLIGMTGMYHVFTTTSTTYVAEQALVEMQAEARAAMEFMVRELRLAYGRPTISTTVTADDTISFDRVEETGYASGGSAATLTDTRKSWSLDRFTPSAASAYTVRIIAGTGVGQTRTIASHTVTQLTLSAAWGTSPDATSLYLITRPKAFTRTAASDHILRYRIGAAGTNEPLAARIATHAFTQPPPAAPHPYTVTITLTARRRDPRSGHDREYTLTETIQRRNI